MQTPFFATLDTHKKDREGIPAVQRTVSHKLVHIPEHQLQQIFLPIIHGDHLLPVGRVGGGFHCVYRQHLGPWGAGSGHGELVIHGP